MWRIGFVGNIIKKTVFIVLALIVLLFGFFFIGPSSETKNITWGVNFSQKHSENLGLDWKENYLALIEDLGAKNIKIASYWDLIEPKEGEYDFNDLDWQIEKAEEAKINVFLVLGMKTPRWPECHIPDWAKSLEKESRQDKILNYLREIVLRYRDSESILMWQVENEPFFDFGECPLIDKGFLKEEIELVRELDLKDRPVLISDSGEGSFWMQAASSGDIVGTTMYKKVWVWQLKTYITYPFPPTFYRRKAKLINWIFKKEVIGVELQAEPWGPELLYTSPESEQNKTMNLERFKENIEFAKKTGLREFYLWGGEWWYWLKETKGNPQIWQEAKKLFQ
ncbi:MAG: beta-galactosidase [Candidatus Nealsonbacteria bacterium]